MSIVRGGLFFLWSASGTSTATVTATATATATATDTGGYTGGAGLVYARPGRWTVRERKWRPRSEAA